MSRQKNIKSKVLAISFSLFFLQCSFVAVSQSKKAVLSPGKITLASAVIPGLGQAINKKIWKTSVVYAGLGGFAYSYSYNRGKMESYQKALDYRLDNDPNTVDTRYADLSNTAIRAQRDRFRRYRDMASLGFIGFYFLQIVDANVDAHLNEFKVNEDLSLKLFSTQQLYLQNPLCLTLSIHF